MSVITTRSGKGSPLTNAEVDENFTSLNTDKLETSAIGTLVPSITGYNNSNWDTAYGWSNHASSGYLTSSTATSSYQPLDGDLTSIAGVAGTSGFLKKTAANTWSLDTITYLTGIDSSAVTTALGYTPYDSTNPSSYITSSGSISGNAATATTSTNLSGGSVDATSGTFTSLTDSGNLTFTGTGNRITGDFSNGTTVNRVMIQSSTTNGNTVIGLLPNGTATTASYDVFNTADPTNSVRARFGVSSASLNIESSISGTGTYVPMTFFAGGSERVRIDTSGNFGIGTGAVGIAGSDKLQIASSGTTAGVSFYRTDAPPASNSFVGINASAYDGSTYVVGGTINFRADENWTSTNHGTAIQFRTTASGSGGALFEAMRINSSGNVGIGTGSPTARLESALVSAPGGAGFFGGANNLRLLAGSGSAFGEPAVKFQEAGTDVGAVIAGKNTANGAMAIVFANRDTSSLTSTLTEKVRIDQNGNVGIGTSSPVLGKLNVTTGFAATDTTSRGLAFFSSSDANTPGSSPSGFYFSYTGAAALAARTSDIAAATFGSGTLGALSFQFGKMVIASTGETIVKAALQETRIAVAASDISLSLGNFFTRTISGTTTLTVSNVPASGTAASFILDLTNGGSATINWWAGVKWAAATAPTLTASGRDVLGFFTHDGGTTWSGFLIAKDVR